MKKAYNLSLEEIFTDFHTGNQGLNEGEIKRRIEIYGENKLPEAKTESYFKIFFRQFQSPLIYVLLLASVAVIAIGETTDGLIILFVMILNAVVGTVQEGKARNTFLALKKIIETECAVLREGKEYIVPESRIVPGDVIILREGDKVPADARVIESLSLKIDESILTGESTHKFKKPDPIAELEIAAADQENMVFMGTNAVYGSGKAVVTATGAETVIGAISKKIETIESGIPLKKEISKLSKYILAAVFGFIIFFSLLGVAKGFSLKIIFETSVAIAVSVIPEGLAIVVTLVLAQGVWRMSKKNVLVKRLQAVEALGQANILAIDKTGTLTKNELMAERFYADGKMYEITGSGYDEKGEIYLEDKIVDPLNHPDLILAGKISGLCANAHVAFLEDKKIWKVSGDPTEAAMLVFSGKVGHKKDILEKENPKIDELPFDANEKIHAVANIENGRKFISISGAPEKILELSSDILIEGKIIKLNSERKKELEKIFFKMSQEGMRVVALGVKNLPGNTALAESISGISFAGFLGMRDVLRAEAKDAIEKIKQAGIKPVMITGDYGETAKAIAEKVGIMSKGEVIISGKEIDELTDGELREKIKNISVYARVSPEQKLKIIKAYKDEGDIIAMTGDGVNDVLSLVMADLGVAMGEIGTEAAKEASDIILIDDNLGHIVSGITEGRSIIKTIKKVILYLFSTSVGEVSVITGSIILGMPLALLPAQIIWLNLITDGFLDISLAMEPKEKNLYMGAIKKKGRFLVDKLMVQRIFFMAIPMMIGTLILFSHYLKSEPEKALSVSLTAMAVFQWMNAWNCRSEKTSIFRMSFFSNRFLVISTGIVILLQLAAIYLPFMQKILHTYPLALNDWLLITAVAFSIIAVEEIRKIVYSKKHD